MTSKGTEKMIPSTIGIDISKDTLDVFRLKDNTHQRFANDKAGHKALIKWIGKAEVRVIFEPTGAYHRQLEQALATAGLPLVKVNPRHVRRFAEATGKLAKTDPLDAALLARMGAVLELEPHPAPSQALAELKELHIARQALVKDRTAAKNRGKTATVQLLKQQQAERLAHIEQQLEAIEAQIMAHIEAEPGFSRRFDILISIPGLSKTTACALLIEMPELGSLDAKEAASLAGLAPVARQSGRWTGRAFIRGGRSNVRHALFMPALVAARFNQDLKAKYEQLIKAGKPAKVALTALMRKLVVLANALLKNNREWTAKTA